MITPRVMLGIVGVGLVAQGAVTPLDQVIPVHKNMPEEWVKSLSEPGTPEVVTDRAALMHVGMPVGGLFCGTVYLGGDGKLWVWDIFNDNRQGLIPKSVLYPRLGKKVRSRDGAAYLQPEDMQPSVFARGFPESKSAREAVEKLDPEQAKKGLTDSSVLKYVEHLQQGFAVKIGDKVRPLTVDGWQHVSFIGSYPIGQVTYSDPSAPLAITLKAFSPFIPMNALDSSLPCTVMSYTIKNTTNKSVEMSIGGWMENAVLCNSRYEPSEGRRENEACTKDGFVRVLAGSKGKDANDGNMREDIIINDFEQDSYGDWKVEGTAFGSAPLENARIPLYMGDVKMHGGQAAVSHNVRDGGSTHDGDACMGKLTSPEITIERPYITFLIAGGNKPGETGLQILVDGKVVRQATGHNGNTLRPGSFNVREFMGKKVTVQVIDQATGGWGNTIVDNIVQSDSPGVVGKPVEEEADYGTICLAIAAGEAEVVASVSRENTAEALFSAPREEKASKNFGEPSPLMGLRKAVSVPANGEVKVTFLISWYFPNVYLNIKGDSGRPDANGNKGKRHYATRFNSADEVAQYVVKNLDDLTTQTELWVNTWYDTTLPRWFMDRTFANTSSLATTTSHRLSNGRFWGWEGIGACEGTCTHVWQYAQAPARLFPELERSVREMADLDLNVGFHENGQISMRGELGRGPAVDGQSGRVMGIWREHTMSKDNEFLKRNWGNAKKAVKFLLDHDTDKDGIIDGSQHNTLDANWFGQIAWTSIEACGAWEAGARMAEVMGDDDFVKECRERAANGRKNIESGLFNGKWFIQKPQPGKEKVFGSYNGSYIDQLFGQSMAYQCGLGVVVDEQQAKTALQSIWTNNFAIDLTKYLDVVRPLGRPYYVEGEGGVLMCTNALNEDNPYGGGSWTHGYLNECMSGFEHQYLSHLMHVGMVKEALAGTRAIHDRYNASKRNPYNEIECSDHYARAMASYGTFISACGYLYNGPEGKLSFAPRMSADNFRAPFTVAEGWGTFAQVKKGGQTYAKLTLKYGQLNLKELSLQTSATQVTVTLNGAPVQASVKMQGDMCVISLSSIVDMKVNDELVVKTR